MDRGGGRRRGALRPRHGAGQQRRHPRLRADREAGRREVPQGRRRQPHRHHARHEVGRRRRCGGRAAVRSSTSRPTAASGASRWPGAYSASKWAVRGLSKTAALELGQARDPRQLRAPGRRRHPDGAGAGLRAERHRVGQEPAPRPLRPAPRRSRPWSRSSRPTRPPTSPAPSGRWTAAPPPAIAASSTECPRAQLRAAIRCRPAPVSNTSSPSSSCPKLTTSPTRCASVVGVAVGSSLGTAATNPVQ